MKIRTKKIYLDRQDKTKGYLIFEEVIQEYEDEEYCSLSLDTQNSFFYLNEPTILQVETLFRKYISKGTTKKSNWMVGSMTIFSPRFIKSIYRVVLRDIWPMLINPHNYDYIPEKIRR